MGQIVNLSLLDGQATPVARVFTPVVASLNEARWSDKSSGRLIGIPTVTLRSALPSKTSPHFKVYAEVSLPTLETITNANASGYTAPPSEAYRCKAMATFIFPARSGTAERKDAMAFLSNLLKNAQFTVLGENFEMPY